MYEGKYFIEASDRAEQQCLLYKNRPSFQAIETGYTAINIQDLSKEPIVFSFSIFLSVLIIIISTSSRSEKFPGLKFVTSSTFAALLLFSCYSFAAASPSK